MSNPNRRLMLLCAGLVLLIASTTWILSKDTRAQHELPAITRADVPLESMVQDRELQDPLVARAAALPVPTDTDVELPRSRPVPDVVRFLKAALPGQFASLTAEEAAAITTLDFRGSSITDTDLLNLSALPNLASLSLRGTAITDAGLACLRNVPKLTTIDLRGTQVTVVGINTLPAERIEALHLTDTHVNGEDLRWLPAMPRLQTFKLNDLKVDDAALATLGRMPSLAHVELDGTQVTDEGLRQLLRDSPGIRRVELRRTPVSRATVAEMFRLHPGIELVQD